MRGLTRLLPFAAVTWLYLATSPYHQGLNNPNEMVRVYMSVAAVDHGSFAIDPVIARWGMVDDKAQREGELFSSKAPLQSLLGVPAYALAKPILSALGLPPDARHVTFALRYLAAVPVGLALAFALLAVARARARELGAPAASGTALGLALALGTMHYPYAITFTGHVLAAACAGGCFVAVARLDGAPPGSGRARRLTILAGALGGAAPFAEYPSALVALPALLGSLWAAPGGRARLERLGGFALGGLPPFLLGLWAHHALWGAPWRTGYGFLENPGYVALHGRGFFGVTAPKLEALAGTLLSPGTGLFFFSPVLLVGTAVLLRRLVSAAPPGRAGRHLAVVSVIAVGASLLFMAGHRGWRGGWTVGPRYIIAVVSVLGFWCLEGLAERRTRDWALALGAASILLTGPAAALYPHLSDVYVNPLGSFLVPSYLQGRMSYGLGHAVGLEGHAANALHLVPLLATAAWVAAAGRPGPTRAIAAWVALAGTTAAVGLVPETEPAKARRENRRLWRFWEPAPAPRARISPSGAAEDRPRRQRATTARALHRRIAITRIGPDGQPTPCRPPVGPCRYGDEPWQRFARESLRFDGRTRPVLHLHPVSGETLRATVPVPPRATQAVLRYGLTDASLDADNPHPVRLTVTQDGTPLAVAEAGLDYGLAELPFTLGSTTALQLTIEVERDGARVLGWDLELYR